MTGVAGRMTQGKGNNPKFKNKVFDESRQADKAAQNSDSDRNRGDHTTDRENSTMNRHRLLLFVVLWQLANNVRYALLLLTGME